MKYITLILAVSGLMASSHPITAATESVIYSFPSGSGIYSQLTGDESGHLYGTSYYGGRLNNGYGYELKEKRGKWNLKNIAKFNVAMVQIHLLD